MEFETLIFTYTIDYLKLCNMLLPNKFTRIWNWGCQTLIASLISSPQKCSITSGKIRQQTFDNWVLNLFHLYAWSWTNLYKHFLVRKRLNPLAPHLKSKKRQKLFLYFVFHTGPLRQSRTQQPQRWFVKITTLYLTASSANPHLKEGLAAGSPSVSTFSSFSFRIGSWYQNPHSFPCQQKNLCPLPTHIHKFQVTLPLGKDYTPLLWSWIFFHLRREV